MTTLESFPDIPLDEALTGRRTEHKLARFLIGADALALLLAVGLSVVIRGGAAATYSHALVWAGATIVFAVLIFAAYRLYERDRQHIAVSSLDEAGELLNALTLLSFIEVCVTETLARSGVRTVGVFTILIFWFSALVLVPLSRAIFRHFVVPLLNNPQNTVIIGAGNVGQNVARKIRKHPEFNLRLVGFLDDDPHPLADDLDDVGVLGGEDALVQVLRRYRATRVVLAFSKRPHNRILEVIRPAGLKDVYLSIVPRYFEIMTANAQIVDVRGFPSSRSRPPGFHGSSARSSGASISYSPFPGSSSSPRSSSPSPSRSSSTRRGLSFSARSAVAATRASFASTSSAR